MAIAHDAATAPERRRWLSDNPLVRAIGRVPLPLGGKLLVGFAVVAALLALVGVLGLVSLSQSNSRGEKLRRLQQTAAYARFLQGDANQLNALIGLRGGGGGQGDVVGGLFGQEKAVAQANDNTVFHSLTLFLQDVRQPNIAAGSVSPVRHVAPHVVKRLIDTLNALHDVWGNLALADLARGNSPKLSGYYQRAGALGNSAYSQASNLSQQTTAQADALVGANHSGFVNSRNLLIGIGGGSLALALALGLLLSWSIVAPLRRTQQRLATIAGGDFGGHVEVANRDEIGALAADVNRMNDELGRLYKELETASRHKSDFLATMSHELRTPLNAIIGFSELLQEQMFGDLNERQLAYVTDVLEAGRHLLSLINDVLDLAKIEAGRMELEPSEVDLPELLRSAVSMHSERASRARIALALTTEPAQIEITADQRRVRQIVFNLLSNAVKFTPADGRVDVSARLDDGHVEIAVTDTGPGIAAQDFETIFEEFEQTTDGRKEEGTGLGLPLSRKLVELHGGRLWVESEPGRGSTFRFTLPVRQEAAT